MLLQHNLPHCSRSTQQHPEMPVCDGHIGVADPLLMVEEDNSDVLIVHRLGGHGGDPHSSLMANLADSLTNKDESSNMDCNISLDSASES